jgi:GTP-binding protein HflX
LFERPRGGERALLVHIKLQPGPENRQHSHFSFEDKQREFVELCESSGAEVVDVLSGQRPAPHPKYFVGSGKAEELRDSVQANSIELVIFNHTLSPGQERNLEKILQCRVLDRTGLILDIFAQRARSFEGKLQVELAQLRHLSTRLVRGWTHLERQKGGIGLRGPGETQLETDRRLIGHRIKHLVARLEKVRSQREQGRRSRQKAATPTVALVGYTNAGKSTLFNSMTEEKVYAADKLFATLDPTLRRLNLPGGSHLVMADTVGFIRDLPHDLVAAFQSTLAETQDADLLLHVVDASRKDRDECITEVQAVLEQIDAQDVPVLMIYNKTDLVGRDPSIERDVDGNARRVWLSAEQGSGTEMLSQVLGEFFRDARRHGFVLLAPKESALRAKLYRNKVVKEESIDDNGCFLLELEINERDLEALNLLDRFSDDGSTLLKTGISG